MKLAWLTTCPSGRAHTHGADDGQTGWRIHLVDEETTYKGLSRTKYGIYETPHGPALCGLRPDNGWAADLFIDEPCKRCVKKAEKLGITPPTIDW